MNCSNCKKISCSNCIILNKMFEEDEKDYIKMLKVKAEVRNCFVKIYKMLDKDTNKADEALSSLIQGLYETLVEEEMTKNQIHYIKNVISRNKAVKLANSLIEIADLYKIKY